jgi:2-oxoglutarate dehydrogenase complex dehydrogenase (E1) component-like enzyme
MHRYIGRKPAASAATGGYKNHAKEQKEIIDLALTF